MTLSQASGLSLPTLKRSYFADLYDEVKLVTPKKNPVTPQNSLELLTRPALEIFPDFPEKPSLRKIPSKFF